MHFLGSMLNFFSADAHMYHLLVVFAILSTVQGLHHHGDTNLLIFQCIIIYIYINGALN